jgi:RNA polymerase sigma-70 factor (ECF subfamily)
MVVHAAAQFAELTPDEVEDVVQETFVRAFQALPRLREPRAFHAWLFAIARNRALTLCGHKRRELELSAALERELSGKLASLIPDALHAEREAATVRELIRELPPGPERDTTLLFYVEGGLTASEIAERLGVGKSAITMRLERFRTRVKRELLRRLVRERLE